MGAELRRSENQRRQRQSHQTEHYADYPTQRIGQPDTSLLTMATTPAAWRTTSGIGICNRPPAIRPWHRIGLRGFGTIESDDRSCEEREPRHQTYVFGCYPHWCSLAMSHPPTGARARVPEQRARAVAFPSPGSHTYPDQVWQNPKRSCGRKRKL
jgi:hypothetical protein